MDDKKWSCFGYPGLVFSINYTHAGENVTPEAINILLDEKSKEISKTVTRWPDTQRNLLFNLLLNNILRMKCNKMYLAKE